MSEETINILVMVIGLPLFGVGLYLWVMATRHMFGLLNGFKPNMGWGRYFPFCVLFPSFFTEDGNRHRESLLKYVGLFIAYCITPFLVIGLWHLFSK